MGRTKPASVRFDPEKLELVKRREKLETAQRVVDFLMDAYYWQNKLFIAPQLNALGQTLPYVKQDQPKSQFEIYELSLQRAGSIEELQSIGHSLENNRGLTPKEKETLHALGQMRVHSLE